MSAFNGFILCCCVLGATLVHVGGSSEAERLYSDLQRDFYSAQQHVRPGEESDTTTVQIGMAIIHLINIDNDLNTVTIKAWMRFMWQDNRLTWNASDYNGIDTIRVPTYWLWKPDIVLYNDFYGNTYFSSDVLALVSSDGTVMWIPPTTLTVPFTRDRDTYYCYYNFGSWTYDGYDLDVIFYDDLEDIDIADYIRSNTYDLTSTSAVKNVKYYPCCEEPYPDLTFSATFTKVSSGWW